MTASAHTTEIDERVGQVVGGRYQITARLGEGGMGAVYRAEHLELGRPVALKVLVDELARNRTAVERFMREARTASAIGHPNIVDVFDLGRDAEGRPYLAMELLEGHDLAEEMRERGGRFEPARVLEILRPIAGALDLCHERGVVHRDLKPSNVFLASLLDGSEQPKLVDFGLAMLFASDERLTRTGFFAGTPEYMPPETARGELSGPAGDVYSLATIAYEMFCGEVPFEAELPNGILVQKIADEAPPMRLRSGRSFPEALERAIAAGLATAPEDRPGGAVALIEGIEAALEGVDPSEIGAPSREPATSAETPIARASAPKESAVRPIERAESTPPAPPIQRSPLIWAAAAALLLILAPAAWWALRDPEPGPVAEADGAPSDAPEASPPAEPAPPEGLDAPGAPAEITVAEGQASEGGEANAGDEATEAPPPADPAQTSGEPSAARRGRRTSGAEDPPERTEEPSRDRPEATRLVRSASSLLIRGDHAGALRLLGRAREADPSYPAIYRTSGLAHERAGRAPAARRDYERYLRMAPGAADADRIRRRVESL